MINILKKKNSIKKILIQRKNFKRVIKILNGLMKNSYKKNNWLLQKKSFKMFSNKQIPKKKPNK